MDRAERRRVRERVADLLRNYHQGALCDELQWIATVERIGCVSSRIEVPGAPHGQYFAPDQPASPGFIVVYAGAIEAANCRVYAHEAAHHLMRTMTTESLFEPGTVEYFDDNPENERHVIACDVVDALFSPSTPKRPRKPKSAPVGGLFRAVDLI